MGLGRCPLEKDCQGNEWLARHTGDDSMDLGVVCSLYALEGLQQSRYAFGTVARTFTICDDPQQLDDSPSLGRRAQEKEHRRYVHRFIPCNHWHSRREDSVSGASYLCASIHVQAGRERMEASRQM